MPVCFYQICQILKGMPIRRQACFSLPQMETNALCWGLIAVGQTLLLIRGEGKRQIQSSAYAVISIILGHSHTPRKLRKWFSLSEVIFSVRSCVAKKSEKAHILLSLGKNNIDFRGFCFRGQGDFLTAAQRKLHLDWEARHFLACVSPLNGI